MTAATTHSTTDDLGGDYLDTVALLQEEIARLEAELRLRDEAAAGSLASVSDPGAASRDEDAERRTAEWTAELAHRDETINLLWEQVLRFEEAEAASRAEWDQLHQWLQDVEQRIEGGDDQARDLQAERDAARRETLRLQREVETDRRAWEIQRRSLEAEIEGLRARLADPGQPAPSDAHRAALELEDRQLRETSLRLASLETAAAEADGLREQLLVLQAQFEEAKQALGRQTDDRERERREHEAELAAQRTRSVRPTLPTPDANLSPDERVRALRQHLRDLHDEEQKERRNHQLSSRISRLWRRTGPSR